MRGIAASHRDRVIGTSAGEEGMREFRDNNEKKALANTLDFFLEMPAYF